MDIKDIILSSSEGQCLNKHRYLLDNIDFIATLINHIPGDIVECGVWKGATLSYMANVFPERTIWAYDSFEGVPTNKENTKYPDKYETFKIQWSTCCENLSADISHLYDTFAKYEVKNTERIKIIKGWFKDTLPFATQSISLLRIDGDLYSSTYEVLEYLYPLVTEGGVVIFDDYCIDESKQAVQDYFVNTKQLPKFYDIHNNLVGCDISKVEPVQGIFVQK